MKIIQIALTLILALTAAVHAAPVTELVLRLHDSQGHQFTYRTRVDAARYANGATPPAGELALQLEAAKTVMANELGYTAKIYGRDHFKLLGMVRVMGAWIEAQDRKDALDWFRGEPERGE